MVEKKKKKCLLDIASNSHYSKIPQIHTYTHKRSKYPHINPTKEGG